MDSMQYAFSETEEERDLDYWKAHAAYDDQVYASKLTHDHGITGRMSDVLSRRFLKLFVSEIGSPTPSQCNNFNSYLKDILDLIVTHYYVSHVDPVSEELHVFRLEKLRFVRPNTGPTVSMARGDYLAHICGTLVYEVREKPLPEEGQEEGGLDPDAMELDEKQEDEPVNESDVFSFVRRETDSEYSLMKSTQSKFIPRILSFPAPLQTDLCTLKVGIGSLEDYSNTSFRCFVFVVSTILKATFYKEMATNNVPLSFYNHKNKRNMVEHRSAFRGMEKRHRTNCTLRIRIIESKCKNMKSLKYPFHFCFDVPHEKSSVLLMALVMAYGGTPTEFIQYVCLYLGDKVLDSEFMALLLRLLEGDVVTEEGPLTSQDQAILHIGSFLTKNKSYVSTSDKRSYTVFMLHEELLPHLNGDGEDKRAINLRKLFCLAEMTAELLRTSTYMENGSPDLFNMNPMDIRMMRYKTLASPGNYLADLTRRLVKNMVNFGRNSLKKKGENGSDFNPNSLFDSKLFEKFVSAVRSGNFNTTLNQNDSKSNVTFQVHPSHEESVKSQTTKVFRAGGGNVTSNILSTSDCGGILDPYATSQNKKCMVVRNMSIGMMMTPQVSLETIKEALMHWLLVIGALVGFEQHTRLEVGGTTRALRARTKVFGPLGWPIGTVAFPYRLYREFVERRRRGVFSKYIGVHYNRFTNTMRFCADAGRPMQVMGIVERGPELFQYLNSEAYTVTPKPIAYMERQGWIEWVDCGELTSGFIYRNESWSDTIKNNFEATHFVIHPCLWFCDLLSSVFFGHNAPFRRLTNSELYNRRVGFQPLPVNGCNTYVSLLSPQRSLFYDALSGDIGTNYAAAMCSLMLLASDNQEEGVIVKREFLERGACSSLEHRTEQLVLPENARIANPTNDKQCAGLKRRELYRHLKPDGLPIEGSKVFPGDVVIGCVTTSKAGYRRCTSCRVSGKEEYYYVDKVEVIMDINDPDRVHVVRIRLVSKIHTPSLGDKLFVTGGQKATIMIIKDSIDMPFSEMTGMVPDIIVSPLALARMTQSFFLEMLLSKAFAMDPDPALGQDDTVFVSPEVMKARLRLAQRILTEHGYSGDGKEWFRDGTTGVRFHAQIYVGDCGLNLAKQKSNEKNHARAAGQGKICPLTGQPVAGQKNGGGKKLSEIANHQNLSSGAASIYSNINVENSAPAIVYYCAKCNVEAIGISEQGMEWYYCSSCGNGNHVGYLRVAHVANLNKQELESIGIHLRFCVSEDMTTDQVCAPCEIRHQMEVGDYVFLSHRARSALKEHYGIVSEARELFMIEELRPMFVVRSPRGSRITLPWKERSITQTVVREPGDRRS